jgi:hypothetical protein
VESSLEAAAETKAATVSLDLISRIADEEFGLTGKFTRLPEISSRQPEPRHSDDATAELVALSLPGGQSATDPVAEAEDDIPELIQDTQPALAILSDVPPAKKPAEQKRNHATLPDIEAIAAQLGAEPAIPGPAAKPGPTPKPVASKPQEPKPAPKPVASKPPAAAPKPEVKQRPAPGAEIELQPDVEPRPEPDFEPFAELELEQPAEQAGDATIPTLTDTTGAIRSPDPEAAAVDDTPDWDRDPTLAELRPDLDALERAMAIAHGRDPDATGEAVPAPEPEQKKPPKVEIEDIPEITLDDSINRKVDMAALERKQRLEQEGIVEAEKADADKASVAAEERAREKKSTAELEKIAEGLARAKTIEDVDDKMAETLFGEELSVAAAAVAARVAEEAAAKASEKPAAAPPRPKSELEKEFENVWGETPGIEVSIDSGIEDQKGGLDISASQRLATVRALNTGNPDAPAAKASRAPPAPAARPDPIEEQITTSLTQTMKALKVNPDPAAINDDDDDDERKGGFFSRFRRS